MKCSLILYLFLLPILIIFTPAVFFLCLLYQYCTVLVSVTVPLFDAAMLHWLQLMLVFAVSLFYIVIFQTLFGVSGFYLYRYCNIVLFYYRCWPGCCLIPFYLDVCKDCIHACSKCHKVVGKYIKM